MISIRKITKEINVGGVTIFLSLHVVWPCFIFLPSFVKLSRTVSKL